MMQQKAEMCSRSTRARAAVMPDARPAGEPDRAAAGDPATGAAEPAPPPEEPALPPAEAAPGTAADAAAPESAGAAEAPVSPDGYPPPEAPEAPPCPARFWLWTFRAARWAALPPQAAEVSNPAVRRTKRRRDATCAIRWTPLCSPASVSGSVLVDRAERDREEMMALTLRGRCVGQTARTARCVTRRTPPV